MGVSPTAPLDRQVAALLEWLGAVTDIPDFDGFLILDTSSQDVNYAAGSCRVSPESLVSLESYSATYNDLLKKGYAWANLSVYGIFKGKLVIGIELPNSAAGVPFGATTINFSGPPMDFVSKSFNWNLQIEEVD